MNPLSRITALALIAGSASALADTTENPEKSSDLLRFTNHDTLHGRFIGFGASDTLIWNNPEATGAINFSTSKLHRVVLNQGKAHLALKQTSHVKLTNGDVIPGKIISADSKTVVMETDHLGKLEIPRSALSKIAPSPFGGKLLYHGPLNKEGWKTLPSATKDGVKKAEPKDDDEKASSDWQHISSAWYVGTDKSRFLVRENAMPDKCQISFQLTWRSSLYAQVALHADFSPPEYEGKVSSQLEMGATIGHGYILNLSNHSASLTECTFDENGKPTNTRLQGSQSSLGLSSVETAHVELRLDKKQKNILFFLNGDFKAKWDLGKDYAGKGAHFAIKSQDYRKSEIRISDIVISHWNGRKDSASSMQSNDRDLILLTNGLDRFSGTFKGLHEGKVSFRGSYQNDMLIPLDEINEITLSSGKEEKTVTENPQAVYFYIHPHGRITGIPGQTIDNLTKIETALLGEITLDTRYTNIIDFSHKNSLFDNWDDNF